MTLTGTLSSISIYFNKFNKFQINSVQFLNFDKTELQKREKIFEPFIQLFKNIYLFNRNFLISNIHYHSIFSKNSKKKRNFSRIQFIFNFLIAQKNFKHAGNFPILASLRFTLITINPLSRASLTVCIRV